MPEQTYDVTDGPAAEVEDSDFEFGALERAQAAVDRLKDIYVTDWAPGAISEMYEVLARVRRPASDRRSCFDAFYRLAHDMKGQGGTFDFPLLTHIGEALCRLTAGRQDAGESEMTVLFAHLEAAKHIIATRLEGDGGAEGDRLMRDLQAMARQHLH